MKNKCLIFATLFAFVALGAVSCNDDESVKEPSIELSLVGTQSEFEFLGAGGEQKVALNVNCSFSAEMSPVDDSSWCKLSVVGNELLIKMLPNLVTETRSSKVKISAGEGEKMQVLYLDVIQKAGDPMSISFSTDKVIFASGEDVQEVTFETNSPNIAYKWQGDSVAWVDIQLDSLNNKFVFSSQFNRSLDQRSGVLEISGGVGGNVFTETLVMEQPGNEPMVRLSPDTVRMDANGGTVEIDVVYTIPELSWFRPYFGVLKYVPGRTDKLSLFLTENKNAEPRSQKLYVGTPPYGYEGPEVVTYLYIYQEGKK